MPLPVSHLSGHVQGRPTVFVCDLIAGFNSVAGWVSCHQLVYKGMALVDTGNECNLVYSKPESVS